MTAMASGRSARLVTVLATDVVGSTQLLAKLGESFAPLIQRQRAILMAAVAARGGRAEPPEGDGCLFLFGSAGDAVAAAVEAQRGLAAEPWPGGVSVQVRMAIHAGEVTQVGDQTFGMALHQTSRIVGVTHGGQIVVSEAAVALLEPLPAGLSLLDLGAIPLRDLVRPVRLYQVVAEGLEASFPPLGAAVGDAGHLPAPACPFRIVDHRVNIAVFRGVGQRAFRCCRPPSRPFSPRSAVFFGAEPRSTPRSSPSAINSSSSTASAQEGVLAFGPRTECSGHGYRACGPPGANRSSSSGRRP
jgi:class 3 adenylate cyclase